MRSDMFKVLTDRARRGGHVQKSKPRAPSRVKEKLRRGIWEAVWDGEDSPLPNKVSMRKMWYGRKYLNDNLQPLIRFLDSRVGKSWDDVYSEIREHLTPRSTEQQRIVDYLKQLVVTSTTIEDGVVGHYTNNKFGQQGFTVLENISGYATADAAPRARGLDWFYVHPETKLLCAYRRKNYQYDCRPIHQWIKLDDTHQYRKIDDVWYIVTLEDMRDNFWKTHRNGAKFALSPSRARQRNDFPPEVIDFGKVYPGSYYNFRLTNYVRVREFGNEFLFSIDKRECGQQELKQLEAILASSSSTSSLPLTAGTHKQG